MTCEGRREGHPFCRLNTCSAPPAGAGEEDEISGAAGMGAVFISPSSRTQSPSGTLGLSVNRGPCEGVVKASTQRPGKR